MRLEFQLKEYSPGLFRPYATGGGDQRSNWAFLPAKKASELHISTLAEFVPILFSS